MRGIPTAVLCLIAGAFWSCRGVDGIDDRSLPDEDAGADTDADADTGVQFGDPGCVPAPFPVPHQRGGIVGIDSLGPEQTYAVSRGCDLYRYEDGDWVMVRARDVGSDVGDSILDCESVLVPQPDYVIDVGGQGEIDWGFYAAVEWFDEEDILDGSSGPHAHGCIPSASADPDEASACDGADTGGSGACDAWLDGAWGPSSDDYIVVGGWAADHGGGCMGDGTMDGFWFNPTRGLMARCSDTGGCDGVPYAPDVALRDVWGESTSDFYVIGNRLIADFEGADWSCVRIESTIYRCGTSACDLEATVHGMLLNAVWGASMDDVFAVGGYWNNGEGGGHLGAIALHRGPDGWSEMDPGTDVALRDVWGTSGNDVYAVGGHENWSAASSVALHYDGDSWSEVDVGATKPLHGVHGDAEGNVHAVGSEGFFLIDL